ncbi:PREDICTED: T-cell activation GTPase-activating protein 1-like isoform X2 [Papilio xuthus]|uniref:T-cell activation GTPase-activating protein 1-like isoform X2 n=1 Tax=Papilio xuthus TaxID=66420 RepID=A0AAJ7E800_PAPXU|nr:PREDICTED: T-cell activation GTPase-activating protein 1-like isoform X2 [Papilio xuthus]
MAQSEDTELRDLVVEALEKNGSLAKIRALLRANIFLVFEDECENIKQNVSLDSILKLPEGVPCPEEKTDVDTAKHSTQQPDIQTPSKTNLSNYNNNKNETTKSESSGKDLTEYSLDFTSPASVKKESVSNDKSSESIHNQSLDYSPKIQEDFDQKSITTPDSISTSDVADILSDKSNSSHHKNIDKNSTYSNKSKSISNYSKKSFHDSIKLLDDDFGDFSESPIPSLSNLSLDIHSD